MKSLVRACAHRIEFGFARTQGWNRLRSTSEVNRASEEEDHESTRRFASLEASSPIAVHVDLQFDLALRLNPDVDSKDESIMKRPFDV